MDEKLMEISQSNLDPRSLRMRLAILQPTPFCNINCRYCYLPHRSATDRMTAETMEHSFRFLLSCASPTRQAFSIVWHSGEPMTLPVEYYRSAFRLLERMNTDRISVNHRFSTNGMLITEEWCQFTRSNGLEMRISLDGPEWLHDANRRDRRGHGTFHRVMRGIELLNRHSVPFLVNCVLTRDSLSEAEQIWRFLRGVGAKGICFCVEEILGANTINSLDTELAIEQLTEFFARLLELKRKEDPSYFVREIDELPQPDRQQAFVNEQALPFRLVTIGWDGGITTFSPELLVTHHAAYGDFIFGNVRTHTVEDILLSPKFQYVYASIQKGISACAASCAYYAYCGGGGPAPKLFETGTFESTETLSCRTKVKAVVDAVRRRRALFSNVRAAALRPGEIAPISNRTGL
jgi:uncharacterized protein